MQKAAIKMLILCWGVATVSFVEAKTPAQTHDYVGEHVFTHAIEGPAVDKFGNLYAVNFAEDGNIGIINKKDNAKLFLKLPPGSVGNGIRFDRHGFMYVADVGGLNVLKINMTTKSVDIYAHSDQFKQPNDLAITRSGVIYISDPDWKEKTGRLWMIDTQGHLKMLEENMGTTNGIEVSADEKYLYVNEGIQRKIWRYDIDTKTGEVSNKRLHIEFSDYGLDGMRCDAKGNLYIARYSAGEVAVVSPAGKLLRNIYLKGRDPTNVTFGGYNGKTVFVTLQDRGAIEYFTAPEPGRDWKMNRE